MAGIILLGALLVIGTPVLALLAFIRAQKLAEKVDSANPQELIGRIYALEQKLARLERLGQSKPAPEPTASPTTAPEKLSPPAAPVASAAEPPPTPTPQTPLPTPTVTPQPQPLPPSPLRPTSPTPASPALSPSSSPSLPTIPHSTATTS